MASAKVHDIILDIQRRLTILEADQQRQRNMLSDELHHLRHLNQDLQAARRLRQNATAKLGSPSEHFRGFLTRPSDVANMVASPSGSVNTVDQLLTSEPPSPKPPRPVLTLQIPKSLAKPPTLMTKRERHLLALRLALPPLQIPPSIVTPPLDITEAVLNPPKRDLRGLRLALPRLQIPDEVIEPCVSSDEFGSADSFWSFNSFTDSLRMTAVVYIAILESCSPMLIPKQEPDLVLAYIGPATIGHLYELRISLGPTFRAVMVLVLPTRPEPLTRIEMEIAKESKAGEGFWTGLLLDHSLEEKQEPMSPERVHPIDEDGSWPALKAVRMTMNALDFWANVQEREEDVPHLAQLLCSVEVMLHEARELLFDGYSGPGVYADYLDVSEESEVKKQEDAWLEAVMDKLEVSESRGETKMTELRCDGFVLRAW